MKSLLVVLAYLIVIIDSKSQTTNHRNDTVCVGELGVIYSVAPIANALGYIWTVPLGANIVSGNNTNSIHVDFSNNAQSGNFTVQGINNCGVGIPSANFFVVIDDCIEETVAYDFFIPQGFSPNADGTNDLFVIRGINYFPNNNITFYNRWGNKVYEAYPYINTWDGKCMFGITVGSDELPVGTYFYLFDLGDKSKVLKGWVYLNR